MASSASAQEELTDKDTLFVGRLVYDVMVYTLPICGVPKKFLPSTDCRENVYHRTNLVQVAGVSTLRSALIMRDKWKLMFTSRRKSTGFNDKEAAKLLGQLEFCCPLTRKKDKLSVVEVFLALCNEILLFCHYERIDIDSISLMKSTASYIVLATGSSLDISTIIEELFPPFDDIENYTRWLISFIKGFAIPYRFKKNVSDNFGKHVTKRFNAEMDQLVFGAAPAVKELKDRLGFVPHDAFSALAIEESNTLPENLALASGSTLPGDRESPEPPELPGSSKSGAVRRRKKN